MAFWSSTKPNPPPITTTLTTPVPVLDVEISDPPSDSISSIQFSSQANILAVGSWDSSVRVYEIDGAGQSQGRATLQHSAPVLSVCWNKDGKVFSGGADAAGKMLDVATGQSMQVAQHDATIKAVKWVETPGTGYLATGSWDKTIRYWDLRQSTPAATIQLPERCYTFDVQFPLMVVGTADRQVLIYDMNNLSTPYKTMESPLKWQTRVVTCLPTSSPAGYAIGSIEGRVAIRYVEEKDNDAKYPQGAFSFKCHRRDTGASDQIFPVNDISFHPTQGTFTTAGSDGAVHFWDKDARARLRTLDNTDSPVVSTSFNHDGSIFAYAVAYDWHKGHMGMVPDHPNKVMLHACKDEEVARRPAGARPRS